MGKYNQGILGPFRGRVGNIIGTFWKGRCIMRIRAASVTNPNTIPQQTQRMKWKLVSSFLAATQKLIKVGFSAVDTSVTAFNNAIKHNLETAITGIFPTLSLDFSKVSLSFGQRLGLKAPVLTSTVANTVKIDWDDNSNNVNAFADDDLLLAVMDETSGEIFVNDTSATRTDGSISILLPEGWSGRSVHVHAFFVKSGLNKVTDIDHISSSQHLGVVVVA